MFPRLHSSDSKPVGLRVSDWQDNENYAFQLFYIKYQNILFQLAS